MTRAHRREDQYRVQERRTPVPSRYDEAPSAAAVIEPKIVNPYAVIALVAALLLLFPVAVVFGLIAFSYPSGRGKAVIALLLGLLEIAAVAWLVLMGHRVIHKAESELNLATVTVMPTPTAQAAPPPAAPPAPVPAPGRYAGTYVYAGMDTVKITDGAAGEENFALSLQQSRTGSGNVGSASGQLTIVDDRATYQSSYGPCQLAFQFAPDTVTITQTAQYSGACGFGAGVQADGKYVRK